MADKLDRRVQRTRQLLRQALTELIDEKGYDAVTVHDITERANLGRTTFYLHYESKEDLMVDHHATADFNFNFGRLSKEELLGDSPEAAFVAFLEVLSRDRMAYFSVTKGKNSAQINRNIRQELGKSLRESLVQAFPDVTPRLPLEALVSYIIAAQMAFIDWWINEKYQQYKAQEIAMMLHQIQRNLIKEAFVLDSK